MLFNSFYLIPLVILSLVWSFHLFILHIPPIYKYVSDMMIRNKCKSLGSLIRSNKYSAPLLELDAT